MSKKLSIIVPVYNMATEGKLNYCLDSLVGQTIRGLYDYEILCVDDASTDDSLEILLDYQKRYPELVCVIPNPVNLRQGGAKNAGLRVAQGEWIGFIDSDDWVSPDYYEKLLKKAEATGADLVGCDYSLVDHHTFEVGKVIVNNTPDQTGDLTKEKHERLFMRPGSMVLKIYKHSVIRSIFSTKTTVQAPCGACTFDVLREWRNRCIIITSMRCPRYITSRRKNAVIV